VRAFQALTAELLNALWDIAPSRPVNTHVNLQGQAIEKEYLTMTILRNACDTLIFRVKRSKKST
jgi:hypothetical protein